MARLRRKHRQAIARGVRRYWRRVKKTAREDNTSIRDARAKIKLGRQIEKRRKRKIIEPPNEWRSPDPEGEVAFGNIQDRDRMEPPPWTPQLHIRFRGYPTVHVVGYWEYRANPSSPAVADDFEFEFDPGSGYEDFWSHYYEALRESRSDILDGMEDRDKYERFGIYITRMY